MRWYAALLQTGPMTELGLMDGPRILLIEDDLGLQQAIAELIREISPGIKVDRIARADEIGKELDESRLVLSTSYDLVISDILLPGNASGLDLWRICQEHSPEVPFLLMSGAAPTQYRDAIQSSPFPPEFLPKPFTRAQLRARIQELLRTGIPGQVMRKAA